MNPAKVLAATLILAAFLEAQQATESTNTIRPMAFMMERTSCMAAVTCPDGGFLVAGSFSGTVDFDPGEKRVVRKSKGKGGDGYVACYGSMGNCRWVVQPSAVKPL